MSKKGGVEEPSREEERASAQEYWNNYSKWTADATKRRDEQVSGIRSRYANQGALRDILIAEQEKEYGEQMKSLQEGEHGTALQKYMVKEQNRQIGEQTRGFRAEGLDVNAEDAMRNMFAGTAKDMWGQKINPLEGPSSDPLNQGQYESQQNFLSNQDSIQAVTDKVKSQDFDSFYNNMFGTGTATADEETESELRARQSASGGSYSWG